MDLFGRKKIDSLANELHEMRQLLISNKSSDEVNSMQLKNIGSSFAANWNVATYSAWDSRRQVESYVELDDIYSIISLLATTAAMIPFYGYVVKNDDALKAYQREGRGTIQKKYYQVKSMDDLPDTDPLSVLLANPNGSSFEFFSDLYTQLYINGECFIWKEGLKYGVNKGVNKLHLLYPSDMIVFVSTTFPQTITRYRYITPYGETIDFEPEEIIQIKYSNPRNLYQQQFRGMSPITALRKRLSRIEGSMDVSVSQMQNGGVPGIVYDEIGAGTKEGQEVGSLRKTAFAAYLNNTANKGAPYFSSGKMGYLPLGLPLVDMDLVALSKEDFAKLCNAYHVSTILLNNDTAATESNVKTQTRSLYTNSILPNVYRVRDAFNSGLVPEFLGNKRFVEADISGVTELQEDLQAQAAALKLMEWITPNEKRKIQRFDDSDEQYMDKIIITNQQMLLDDLGGVPDPADPNIPNDNPDANT